MGSVVNNRLEATTRGTDLLPGLHARVHDGWWLLARQWQLGELDGTDAGSPVNATLVTRYVPIASWQPDGGPAAPYPATGPLEALVESDGSPLPWRDVVAAGLRLSRALRRAGVDAAAVVAAHPLAVPDPAADPDLDPAAHATSAVTPDEVAAVGAVTAGRVPDPMPWPRRGTAAPTPSSPPPGARAPGRCSTPGGPGGRPGSPRRRGPGSLTTSATPSPRRPPTRPCRSTGPPASAAVRWTGLRSMCSHRRRPRPPARRHLAPATAGPAASALPAASTTRAIPVPVTFHGSPVGRYWQLEDASTDLGAIDTYPTELGKLLLAEFTACFAGDWYRLPVRVPYGSAVHIEALVSTDTFGVSTLVPSAAATSGNRPWRMYEHSVISGTADGSWLMVPPVLAASMDSAPVEEIVLVRDPAADLVWGIEHIVTNAVGRPVRRDEDLRAQGRQPAPDPRDGLPDAWVWRLATSVPENWIPFLPTRGRADNDDYQLVQGAMVRYRQAADGTLTAVPVLPAGLLLRAGGTLPEREVPAEGRLLQRTQAPGPLGGRQPGPVVVTAHLRRARRSQQRPRLRRTAPDVAPPSSRSASDRRGWWSGSESVARRPFSRWPIVSTASSANAKDPETSVAAEYGPSEGPRRSEPTAD